MIIPTSQVVERQNDSQYLKDLEQRLACSEPWYYYCVIIKEGDGVPLEDQ